jgi:hypothetical protein
VNVGFYSRTWSYVRVLVAELFLIFLAYFMQDNPILYVIFVAALLFVFGSVITTIWQSRVLRVLALISGTIAIITGFLWIVPGISEGMITIAFSICFFAYAAFALISIIAMIENVFTLEEVTADRIVGSICIYVLIGLFFSFVYLGLDLILPGTFNYGDSEVMTLANVRDHIYFSYVTLTTLGYGDIVPLLPLPKLIAMLEAMTGQIYLVVMVAMLVGMHVSKRMSEIRKGS